MYSPKINEDLIQMLYRLRVKLGIPMTKLVDEILRPEVIKRHELEIESSSDSIQLNQLKPIVQPVKVQSKRTSRLTKGEYHVNQ